MTMRDLHELQELVFRTCVRNMMFLMILPYHLSQETARNRAPERASADADDRRRAISGRPHSANRGEDARWLR